MGDREIHRLYATAGQVFFALRDSSDDLVSASFVAGDVQISKDNGAYVNVATLPTQISTSGTYKWIYSIAEMTAFRVVFKLVDSPSKVWVDKVIVIDTLGVNVQAIGNNSSAALSMEDYFDSWHNTYLEGSPTPTKTVFKLNAGDALNDFYNRSILIFTSGTNKGAGRIVVDWVSSSQLITLDEDLPYTPAGSENVLVIPIVTYDMMNKACTALASLPSVDTGTLRQIIQLIGNISKNKKIEIPTLQTIRNEGDGADLGTRSIAKVSTTLTVGKLT